MKHCVAATRKELLGVELGKAGEMVLVTTERNGVGGKSRQQEV